MSLSNDTMMTMPVQPANTTYSNDGWGNNGAIWLVLLFLFFGFNRNGLNNTQGELGQYATAASQQEILFNQHFNQLNDRMTNLGNGICDLGYRNARDFGDLSKENALGQSNIIQSVMSNSNTIQSELASCCCENRLATANLSAQMDKQTSSINSNIDAKFAELQKSQLEQTIAAQTQRINQLELQAQMAGVVRYPNGYTYNAGNSPFCGCGTCGNI